MVCDADGGVVDVVVLVGAESCVAEVWHLGDKGAIFCANVKAGAEFIGEAATVKKGDDRLRLHVERSGLQVADIVENQRCAARLDKWIELAEGEIVHIGRTALLQLGIDDIVVGRSDVMDVVLDVLIVGLDGTTRGEHEAIAEESADASFGANLDVCGAGHVRLDESRCADAEILPTLLGMRHNRADGKQEGKKGDFLHSFLNLVTACLHSRGESLNGVLGCTPLSEL